MGFRTDIYGRCVITCDDPYSLNCKNIFNPHYSNKERTKREAKTAGWFHNEQTDKYACHSCTLHHQMILEEKIGSDTAAKGKSAYPIDPFAVVEETEAVTVDTPAGIDKQKQAKLPTEI